MVAVSIVSWIVGAAFLLRGWKTTRAEVTREARLDAIVRSVLRSRDEVLSHVAPDDRRRVRLKLDHALARGGVEAVLDELRNVAVGLWAAGRHLADVLRVLFDVHFDVAAVVRRHEYERRRDRLRLLVDVGMTHRPRAPGRGVALASAIPAVLTTPRGSPV